MAHRTVHLEDSHTACPAQWAGWLVTEWGAARSPACKNVVFYALSLWLAQHSKYRKLTSTQIPSPGRGPLCAGWTEVGLWTALQATRSWAGLCMPTHCPAQCLETKPESQITWISQEEYKIEGLCLDCVLRKEGNCFWQNMGPSPTYQVWATTRMCSFKELPGRGITGVSDPQGL